ncbi:sensor histidine kinase [Rubrobacter marinus]|uniref:Sensor histidine kinase n=1 Tax=Rubrobacter marinus TaxID=2653852 RepID=A0A6G8PWR9_9ACTN|nr:histidine kinase [Rubrobacter marinus]QIN78669.1 sensor histidine kinase [Rubrobacter marinus]
MRPHPTGRGPAGIPDGLLLVVRERRLVIARVAWVFVAAVAVAVFAAGLPALYAEVVDGVLGGEDLASLEANLSRLGLSVGFYAAWFSVVLPVAVAAVFFAVAGIVFWRRPDEPMALFVALLLVLFGATRWEANEALAASYPVLKTASSLLESLSLASVFAFFYLFPDGRFVPRWTRWVAPPLVAYLLLASLWPASVWDPKGWSGLPHGAFFGGCLVVGLIAQALRYRLSGAVERQQTKWVVFGFAAALAVYVAVILVFFVLLEPPQPGTFSNLAVGTVFYSSALCIPLSLGVAILRYRLWDIDVIINRTLVYASLTLSVVALYVLLVGGIGALFQARGTFLASLLATGVVAVAFAPLRDRLQRGIDRLMYGERDDPYRVLSRLGRRLEAALEPETVLPTIVETVAGALRLPYAAIAMRGEDGFEISASYGTPTGEGTVLPLSHGGETVGRLILAPRAPGEGFSPADRSLLEDLARNAEVAVHAVKLTADLRRSKERLVTAREEERRRLRRDLHDGLGPTLGSLALGLDVSRRLLKTDPREADEMLAQLKAQAKDAVGDVRRLVYGLRPPALDDLGLVGAIREQAAKHGRLLDDSGASEADRNGRLAFRVEAPAGLPPLPAAVEVSCYRIAQEALNNVVRHARADSCLIRLSISAPGDELRLDVVDDGIGLPDDPRAGVGMSSMAERAEELVGKLTVEPVPTGGTRVVARLPLFEREAE